jgi:glutamine amidotransferase
MCRLFAAISTATLSSSHFLKYAPQSLLFQSHVDRKRLQGDGWGLGWFENGKPQIYKSPRAIYRDMPALNQASQRSGGNVLLGHIRWASNPLKLPKRELIGMTHTQPFTHGPWLFVHNGTLYIPREVKAALGPWAKFVKGKNDSEVLFYWILKYLSHKGRGDIVRAVRAALKGLDQVWKTCRKQYPLYAYPYHGLNWVLSNGQMMIAFCYVDPRGFSKTGALVNKSQPYYQMQLQQTDQTVTLASEPLTPETHWDPIRHGELLIVENKLDRITLKRQKIA